MAATRSEEETTASALPTELLEDIGKRVNTKSDVSRLRAVCRSWRSSIPPVHPKLQTFNINCWLSNDIYKLFNVRETAIYYQLVSPAINPDKQVKRDWLVKLHRPYPKEPQACEGMNLLDFNGFELTRTYEGVWKLVMSPNLDSPDFMMIYTGSLYHGKLGRDEHEDVNAYKIDYDVHCYVDVIFCQGMFYAVDSYVAVDSTIKLTKIASPSSVVLDDDEKRLLESSGDLLLVERNQRMWGFGIYKNDNFTVFKLNAVEKKWVVMQALDLSDRILVVLDGESYRGQSCGFSVAAENFPGCQGNCIYYSNSKNYREKVFDMGTGTLSDLRSLPHSSRLFLRSLRKETNQTMNVS